MNGFRETHLTGEGSVFACFPELVQHLNPMMGWESLDLEAALADAFRRAGISWIEGGH